MPRVRKLRLHHRRRPDLADQESILGPILWNVVYTGVLRVGLPRKCSSVAYADDLAVMAEAAFGTIVQWAAEHGITMEPSKTEQDGAAPGPAGSLLYDPEGGKIPGSMDGLLGGTPPSRGGGGSQSPEVPERPVVPPIQLQHR